MAAPKPALFPSPSVALAFPLSKQSAMGAGAGSGFQSVWQSLIQHALTPTDRLLTQESPNFSKGDVITSFPADQPVIPSITLISTAKKSQWVVRALMLKLSCALRRELAYLSTTLYLTLLNASAVFGAVYRMLLHYRTLSLTCKTGLKLQQVFSSYHKFIYHNSDSVLAFKGHFQKSFMLFITLSI